jgi:hypothetical protein
MSAAEQQLAKYFFFEMKDYTLISIKAPTIDEHLYICKKGCHALNIQCACDGNCS